VAELREAVVDAWNDVSQEHIDNCINSLPKRLALVRAVKGDRIGY
jgi:hypothetical protein